MPVMDGYQLCREIRGNDRLRNLPFIFLTATYIEDKDEAFALKLGADGFFRKPFNPRTFMEDITALMERIETKKRLHPEIASDDKEFLTIYNERLIHKLESKMVRLEEEIGERQKAEKILRATLQEREALIREIHHRVKNNMQIISSLINLSSRDIKDPETLDILRQIKLRIRSISMIHEKLLKSEVLGRVDFTDFLQDLAVHLGQFFRADPNRIHLKMEMERLHLPIETAVPCGLLAGEMLSNSLKHAFPEGRSGDIVVSLRRVSPEEILLGVRDEGIGIPGSLDVGSAESMGLTIMNTLIHQVGGRLEVFRDHGADFRVTFKAPV
jgi:two-component sensor histidine kinase